MIDRKRDREYLARPVRFELEPFSRRLSREAKS